MRHLSLNYLQCKEEEWGEEPESGYICTYTGCSKYETVEVGLLVTYSVTQ